MKVLNKVSDYLQEWKVHLHELRDLLKKVMLNMQPQRNLKSPALETMSEEAEAEIEHLGGQYIVSQRELAIDRHILEAGFFAVAHTDASQTMRA